MRLERLSNTEFTVPPPRPPPGPKRAWILWLAFLSPGIILVGVVLLAYLPLRRQNASYQAQLAERTTELQKRTAELEKSKKDLAAASSAKQSLTTERDQLEAERQAAIKEKEDALAELERLKNELTTKLEVEVQSGDIAIRQRGHELVVDVADKVLFDIGEVDINERGQKVLTQVAQTLASFQKHTIQVGGHTDSAPVISPKVRERFPTNWELSTGRASNVVRFLQEKGRIPGKRLVAAGFAQFRPTASNQSSAGRAKNRRIEIVLLPPNK